tara:strand:- start:1703 stop:2005 length:303 start_codon:yes stop_codon:yes gene_type:complete
MSEVEEVVEEVYNPYKRKLTINDEEEIRKMMEHNPVIDRILAETICLMPPEDLKEICDLHSKEELKDPYPNKEFVAVYKTAIVEPEPEPLTVLGFDCIKE